MTWVDGAALLIVILSAVFSMVRGFVREVLGVFAWVGAAFAALRFYPLVQPYVNSVLPMKNLVVYVSMGAVFLVTLVVLSVVSALIGGMVRDSALSGLDRSLGLVFGVVRGAVIVCLAYIALSVGVDRAQWPAPVVNARFLPWAHEGAVALVSYLPRQYQPEVAPLSGAATPSAATLMQTPVAGSALAH
ncbi:CvpA family protein [Acidocella sp.]|jgi:membrane protein required for colicin V production|uniref:CvpA family protein n=1 Tax=Acidocella sp. TaxID=50710 RepID=UPI002F40DE30